MKDLDLKRLGEILRGKRLIIGLSQEEVAALIGVTPETLAGYERGARRPGGRSILKLQVVLGISAGDLVGDDK